MALTALASRTLHDQAYHALYHAILEGDLEPGSRIIEAEISAALGISRGPVREAIRRLEAEGLLVTRAYRGTHIVRLSGHDVVELYAVRAALEGCAAVSGLDVLRAEHLEAMEEQLDGLDQAARAPDWDRVAVLDADWHSHITMAGSNARLHAMWTTSNGPLRVLFARAAGSIYRPEQVRERHATLLNVLRTGDPWTIEQAIREHYLTSARHLAAHVEQ